MPKNLSGHPQHVAVIKGPRRNADLIAPVAPVEHLRPAIRAEPAFGPGRAAVPARPRRPQIGQVILHRRTCPPAGAGQFQAVTAMAHQDLPQRSFHAKTDRATMAATVKIPVFCSCDNCIHLAPPPCLLAAGYTQQGPAGQT